jgi:signal peptidase I
MSKFPLTICAFFGLLLTSASAQEAIRIMTLPSSNMLPTIPVGSTVFVNARFPTNQLNIGDIVTFYRPKDPQDKSEIYLFRIVGMGADRIQMIDGVLNINGQAVKREQVEDYIPLEDGAPGKPIKRWRETLPNRVSYMTLDLVENGFYDNTPVYNVPANHYFMMGDNRDNSTDSRVLSRMGYIPVENIIGKVQSWSSPPSPGEWGYQNKPSAN